MSDGVEQQESEKRTIGPVTLATGYGAAVTTVLCWILSLFGVEVPNEVQGAVTVLVVLAAGYAVKPRSKGRYEA